MNGAVALPIETHSKVNSNHMKLPRWLVILMLSASVLSVLVAAGWWWVTWPERTAREFVELIRDERVEDALAMIQPSPGRDEMTNAMNFDFESHLDWRSKHRTARLETAESRSPTDFALGRQRFCVKFGYPEVTASAHFEVRRGTVFVPPLKIYFSFVRFGHSTE